MSESTIKKLTLGNIISNVRARLRKTQSEFVAWLEMDIDRSCLSGWERDKKKPYRRHMILLIEKITPQLRPEELVALEELSS